MHTLMFIGPLFIIVKIWHPKCKCIKKIYIYIYIHTHTHTHMHTHIYTVA